MKKHLLLNLTFSFLSALCIAQSQKIVIPHNTDIMRYKYQEKMSDFTGLSSMMTQLSFINLTTSTGETDITANIGFLYKRKNVFNLQINTPFNGKRTEALNVDGLSKSSSLSFGFQHNFVRNMNVSIRSSELTNAFEKIGKERKPECCGEKPDTLIQTYTDLTPDERLKLESLLTYVKFLPFIGLKAKVGYKSFDFFTDTTLSKIDTQDLYEYEGRFILGSQLTNHSSFAASFIAQAYYDAGDAGIFNRATINPGVSKQQELYPYKPELKTKINVQIEYRKIMKEGKYAIQPIISADLNNQILDAKLQFYFLNLKEEDKFKGLNGGVFIGYRTGKQFETGFKKDNILVGVFFSPVFNINRY